MRMEEQAWRSLQMPVTSVHGTAVILYSAQLTWNLVPKNTFCWNGARIQERHYVVTAAKVAVAMWLL